MRVMYRNLLEVRNTEAPPAETVAALRALVCEWASASAAKYTKPATFPNQEGTYDLGAGVSVRLDAAATKDGQAEVFSLRYTHADQSTAATPGNGLVWTTECRVSRVVNDIEFDLVISCGYADYRIAPMDVFLGAPKVLKQVMDRFTCYRSGIPVHPTYRMQLCW